MGVGISYRMLKPTPQPDSAVQERQVTFGEGATFKPAQGWQGVIVTIQPPPPSEDLVQVWIQQGDTKWYPCDPTTEISGTAKSWMTRCRFGNPDSPLNAYHAKNGRLFTLGAFTWKTRIPDEGGLSEAAWDAFTFKKQTHTVAYHGM